MLLNEMKLNFYEPCQCSQLLDDGQHCTLIPEDLIMGIDCLVFSKLSSGPTDKPILYNVVSW